MIQRWVAFSPHSPHQQILHPERPPSMQAHKLMKVREKRYVINNIRMYIK